ncbi:hypothetical protein AcV7_003129 [Taiwanofungus camphoratus]|nr:hypothetical protein AcV7_003129 [Antrodia cinnamomea]
MRYLIDFFYRWRFPHQVPLSLRSRSSYEKYELWPSAIGNYAQSKDKDKDTTMTLSKSIHWDAWLRLGISLKFNFNIQVAVNSRFLRQNSGGGALENKYKVLKNAKGGIEDG